MRKTDSKKLLAHLRAILKDIAKNWTVQVLQDWIFSAALRAHSRAHLSGLLETNVHLLDGFKREQAPTSLLPLTYWTPGSFVTPWSLTVSRSIYVHFHNPTTHTFFIITTVIFWGERGGNFRFFPLDLVFQILPCLLRLSAVYAEEYGICWWV